MTSKIGRERKLSWSHTSIKMHNKALERGHAQEFAPKFVIGSNYRWIPLHCQVSDAPKIGERSKMQNCLL
jgi:hypothetical protein